jgi:hypothetical protein
MSQLNKGGNMDKQGLLKQIADTAYNVGYGSKRHFATYDIVDKIPETINFLSLAIGVYALIFDILSTKFLSATFVILGITGLYINFYKDRNGDYEKKGVFLTQLYNELKSLYYQVKSSTNSNFDTELKSLADIESRFYSSSISKQILFSDWYAHYKFFWQHQIDWIDEQKKFRFFRDKIPLSLSITVIVIVSAAIFCLCNFSTRYCNWLSN